MTAARLQIAGRMPDAFWRGLSCFLTVVVILQFYLLLNSDRDPPHVFAGNPPQPVVAGTNPQHEAAWTYNPSRDASNIGLTDAQCEQAFPDLYYEIDRAAEYWRNRGHTITQNDTDIGWRHDGAFRVLIHNNQLRILETKKAWVPYNYRKRTFYTLLQMHRALLGAQASGERLPSIEFAVVLDDKSLMPGGGDTHSVWAYTRQIGNDAEEKLWPMPDFQFFASPPYAGSFSEMQGKAQAHDGPLSGKIPKVVWRGRTGTNKNVREALIARTVGKDWADVVETGFGDVADAPNRISMDNLCQYRFVIHTEGRSWSGRLKYLLNCDSVPIVHKLHWTAEYYSLLKPDGPDQNYIEVERDWSDLEQKVKYYLEHPEEAQRIANNAKATFRERYTSPAAEGCYWRRMIYGYSKVAFEPEPYETVTVTTAGRAEDEQHLRGWAFEQFLWVS